MTSSSEPVTSFLLFLQAGEDHSAELKTQGDRRYRKDVIRCGRWYVPHLEMWLEVDEARMDRWIRQFEIMQSNGVTVDLTLDHQTGAESRRGEILNLFREDQTLFMEVEVADEDSETLIHRCPQVSLELQRHFIDGHGHQYDEALTAVSIVRQPVACAQGEFESMKTDAQPPSLVQASCKERQACFALADSLQHSKKAQLDHVPSEDAQLMQLSLLEASQRSTVERLCDIRLSRLCETGRISPAVLKSCRGLFQAGHDTATVMMSARVGESTLAESVLDLLEQLPGRSWEMQTGAQLLALPDELKQQNNDLTKQMIDEANRHGQYQV